MRTHPGWEQAGLASAVRVASFSMEPSSSRKGQPRWVCDVLAAEATTAKHRPCAVLHTAGQAGLRPGSSRAQEAIRSYNKGSRASASQEQGHQRQRGLRATRAVPRARTMAPSVFGRGKQPAPESFWQTATSQKIAIGLLASGASVFLTTLTPTYQLPSMLAERGRRLEERGRRLDEQGRRLDARLDEQGRRLDTLLLEIQTERRELAEFGGQLARIPLPACPTRGP